MIDARLHPGGNLPLLSLSTLFGQETLDYRLHDAGAWMEQLEHGLTPPFGSSYAGRPASRGMWWSACPSPGTPPARQTLAAGSLLAADRADQRPASCSRAAPGGAGRKEHTPGACTSGSRVVQDGRCGRWKRHDGKGCLNS